jgi:hypothetical protein
MLPQRIRLAWGVCLVAGVCLAGCGDDDSGPGDAGGDVDVDIVPDVPIDTDAPDHDADVPVDGDEVPADVADDGPDAGITFPPVAGSYPLVADFEPLDLLPEQVQRLVTDVGDILARPGGALLRLLAVTACEMHAECTDYWAWSYLDYIYDPPAAGGDPALNAYGTVVATILEANLLAGIRAVRPGAGATLEEILGPGRDVFDNAEGWRLEGRLDLAADADALGLLGNANAVSFDRATWRWIDAEAAFVLRDGMLVGAHGIEAALHPYPPDAPDGSVALRMSPFDLGLEYAALLVQVLESVVFPRTIDPSIDSFERFFGYAFDCAAFAGDVASRGGTYELLAPLLETACTNLASSAGSYLAVWIDERTEGVRGYFRLGSPDAGACPASVVSGPGGPVVERFGEDRDGARCRWEGASRFGADEGETLVVEWATVLRDG